MFRELRLVEAKPKAPKAKEKEEKAEKAEKKAAWRVPEGENCEFQSSSMRISCPDASFRHGPYY